MPLFDILWKQEHGCRPAGFKAYYMLSKDCRSKSEENSSPVFPLPLGSGTFYSRSNLRCRQGRSEPALWLSSLILVFFLEGLLSSWYFVTIGMASWYYRWHSSPSYGQHQKIRQILTCTGSSSQPGERSQVRMSGFSPGDCVEQSMFRVTKACSITSSCSIGQKSE